jgi:hypothetical protein
MRVCDAREPSGTRRARRLSACPRRPRSRARDLSACAPMAHSGCRRRARFRHRGRPCLARRSSPATAVVENHLVGIDLQADGHEPLQPSLEFLLPFEICGERAVAGEVKADVVCVTAQQRAVVAGGAAPCCCWGSPLQAPRSRLTFLARSLPAPPHRRGASGRCGSRAGSRGRGALGRSGRPGPWGWARIGRPSGSWRS